MWFCSVNRRTCITASILVLILLLGLAPDSQAIERLRVTVGDTTGTPGQKNSVITVFLTNTQDQIAAFTVHLILTRNDIANFQNNLDTVVDTTYWKEWCCTQWNGTLCVDSARDTCAVDFPDLQPWDFRRIDTAEVFTGSLDTVHTLIAGWEMVESRAISTGDLGLDIKVSAIADRQSVPGIKPPINPQQGGVLFRLLADIFPIPAEQTDRTVGIVIDVSWKPYFAFSTPGGQRSDGPRLQCRTPTIICAPTRCLHPAQAAMSGPRFTSTIVPAGSATQFISARSKSRCWTRLKLNCSTVSLKC